MASLMGSHGVALATAMAVSGTVILLAFCRQRPLPAPQGYLRSCISSTSGSEEKKRERASCKKKKKKKKKKRVHFAAQVVELHRETTGSGDDEEELATLTPESMRPVRGGPGMPANRVALYNGILQDRLHRMACSY